MPFLANERLSLAANRFFAIGKSTTWMPERCIESAQTAAKSEYSRPVIHACFCLPCSGRPSISMFTLQTNCDSGIGGFSTNAAEPFSPFSSAEKHTNAIERLGCGPFAIASARSNTAVVPVASSSAPLWIASPSTGAPTPTWS